MRQYSSSYIFNEQTPSGQPLLLGSLKRRKLGGLRTSRSVNKEPGVGAPVLSAGATVAFSGQSGPVFVHSPSPRPPRALTPLWSHHLHLPQGLVRPGSGTPCSTASRASTPHTPRNLCLRVQRDLGSLPRPAAQPDTARSSRRVGATL